jgi:hypothetical protein
VTGPPIMFSLVISLVGGLVAAGLLIIGKRGWCVYGLASFSIALASALVLVPLIWPYTDSNKLVPIDSIPRPNRNEHLAAWCDADLMGVTGFSA